MSRDENEKSMSISLFCEVTAPLMMMVNSYSQGFFFFFFFEALGEKKVLMTGCDPGGVVGFDCSTLHPVPRHRGQLIHPFPSQWGQSAL